MKKTVAILLLCMCLFTACTNAHTGSSAGNGHHEESHHVKENHFVISMGCEDKNCTDSSHYHHCSTDCNATEHHHEEEYHE